MVRLTFGRGRTVGQKGGGPYAAVTTRCRGRAALRADAVVQRRWSGRCSNRRWTRVSRALQGAGSASTVAPVSPDSAGPPVSPGSAGPPVCAAPASAVSGASTTASRASSGAVVRVRPAGSVQVAVPSLASRTLQPGRLLHAVVTAAEGQQVRRLGRPGGPGTHVVKVAEPGRDRAAGEAAPAVAGADQGHEGGAGTVGSGRQVVCGVEAGSGEWVARRDRRTRPRGAAVADARVTASSPGGRRARCDATSSGSDGRAPCTSREVILASGAGVGPRARSPSAGTVSTTWTSTVALAGDEVGEGPAAGLLDRASRRPSVTSS